MTSTYSPNLGLELITTGEQSGSWGTTTNNNLGTYLEQAIVGYVTQSVTDGADTVLTIPQGASSPGRNFVIELTNTLTAARNVIVPAVQKPYIFFNNTVGGYAITVKVSGQTGVTIANGKKALVYTNGTDVIEFVNAPVTEAGTQTLTNKTVSSSIIKSRITTIADGTSVTINGDTTDIALQTNTQAAGTLTINAPTGTPFDGQKLVFRLKSTNVQTFSWNAIFASSNEVVLPVTSTGSGKYDYVGFMYNSINSKWQILARNLGFAA
jgi:hypothetical protein